MLSTDSAEALRKHIIRNTTIKYINDVSHFKVFESAQTYCIVWQFSKNKNEDYGIRMNSCYDFEGLHNTKFVIPIKDVLDDDKFIIPTSSNYSLFAKIERGNQPLNYYAHNICWGTSMTGYGKMKIEMNEYDNLPEKEKSKYAKIVQTADIKQHYIEWKEEFLPKSIYSQRVQKLFKQHKIVVARVTKSIQSSLDFDNYYVAKSTLITDVDYHCLIFRQLFSLNLLIIGIKQNLSPLICRAITFGLMFLTYLKYLCLPILIRKR